MEKFELQKLRDLPIEGVAERLGLRVERHKSLCPFHDDSHPSLSFSVRRNTYRCFVCGASGGTIDLVMRHLHLDFKEACRWLANEHNVIICDDRFKVQGEGFKVQEKSFDASRYARFFEHPFLNDEARKFLFDERKLDPRVVSWCRLTSWRDKQGTPWLQIPYFNREGKLIGVQNRNLGVSGFRIQDSGVPQPSSLRSTSGRFDPSKNPQPRFRFPQGSECGIYNLPVLNLLKPNEPLFITEGCSDCWAMLSAGHKAIAIPSATLLTQKDVDILSTLNSPLSTEYHMYPDRDEPGERLFLQLKQVLPSLVHHQLSLGCKDFSEMYLKTLQNNEIDV